VHVQRKERWECMIRGVSAYNERRCAEQRTAGGTQGCMLWLRAHLGAELARGVVLTQQVIPRG
jgi:hypothetical protein